MLNDYSHYYPITVPLLWHCLKQYRQTTSACYFADQKKGVFPSEGGFFVVIQMFTGGYMYQIHSNPPDVRSAKPSPMSPVQCLTVPLRMGVSSVQECARQVPSSGYLIGKSEKKTIGGWLEFDECHLHIFWMLTIMNITFTAIDIYLLFTDSQGNS